MTLNTKGFTAVEGLLILVIIVLIGFVGWKVWDEHRTPGVTPLSIEGSQDAAQ